MNKSKAECLHKMKRLSRLCFDNTLHQIWPSPGRKVSFFASSGSRDEAAWVAQLLTKKPRWHDKHESPIRFGVNLSLISKLINRQRKLKMSLVLHWSTISVEKNEISGWASVKKDVLYVFPGIFCTCPSWVLFCTGSSWEFFALVFPGYFLHWPFLGTLALLLFFFVVILLLSLHCAFYHQGVLLKQ